MHNYPTYFMYTFLFLFLCTYIFLRYAFLNTKRSWNSNPIKDMNNINTYFTLLCLTLCYFAIFYSILSRVINILRSRRQTENEREKSRPMKTSSTRHGKNLGAGSWFQLVRVWEFDCVWHSDALQLHHGTRWTNEKQRQREETFSDVVFWVLYSLFYLVKNRYSVAVFMAKQSVRSLP